MKYLPLSILPLLFSACTTYQTITAADGNTYLAYECTVFDECMQGVFEACPASFEVVSLPVLPLFSNKTPMQVFAPGSGLGQIVFRCKSSEVPAMMVSIQDDLKEIAKREDEHQRRLRIK